jgi:hypothetical protein
MWKIKCKIVYLEMKLKTLKISQFHWIYLSSLEIIAIEFIALKKGSYSYTTVIKHL